MDYYDAGGIYYINAPLELRPWHEKALVRHDKFLFSYGQEECQKYANLREVLRIPNEVLVMTDSGGYQVATRGAMIDPIAGFEWQVRNGNSIISMDIPPRSRLIHAKGEYPMDDFNESIKSTRKVLERLRPYYEKRPDDVELLLVLHGGSIRQYEMWWKECIDPFLDLADGVFIAARNPSSALPTIEAIIYISSHDIKRIHVGGVGKRSTIIPALAYVEWKLNLKLSFDLSTSLTHVVWAHYMTTFPNYMLCDLGYRSTRGRRLRGKYADRPTLNPLAKVMMLPCACPACEEARRKGIVRELILYPTRREYFYYLALHNLWSILHWLRFCEVFVRLKGEDFEYLNKKVPQMINQGVKGTSSSNLSRWF